MFKFFKSKITKISSFFKKISIGKKLKELFSKKIDGDLFEELEKILYESDLGVKTSLEITEDLKKILKKDPNQKIEDILKIIKEKLVLNKITFEEKPLKKPHVLMIVGVNGSGKTTSIAKIAKYYKNQDKKVLLIAADTYRYAAIEQLELWANRTKVDIVKNTQGADPSSVVFDGLKAAIARDIDIVLIDTAGRLHTKTNLMQELEKIKRTADKVIPSSPHETILVVDATTGQNAIDQAKIFNTYTPITSIFLTKLDGTAKGGIVISIQKELKIPIKWIGIGENSDDIEDFDFDNFIDGLLSID